MNFVSWSVTILVVLLFSACLTLLWLYADWPKRIRAVTSVLAGLLVIAVLTSAYLQPPRYELAILPASADAAQPGASEAVPEQSAPAPEPVSEPIAPEPEPEPEPTAPAPEPTSEPIALASDPVPEPPPAETVVASAPAPAPVGVKLESSYILNTSSKKFHRPSCSDAGRIKESNRGAAASREEAINQGYDACKRCKP